MPKLLVVDLLAEREAFGKKGVEEIVRHFPEHEVLLWAPHTDEVRDYGFGKRIDAPEEADAIVITGSRRNVSMWEPWMDDVAKLSNCSPIKTMLLTREKWKLWAQQNIVKLQYANILQGQLRPFNSTLKL